MGNVSKRFFIVFFESLLMFIVLVNYLGWSGGYIDVVGGTSVDWSSSYFGFQSIQGMISFFDKAVNLTDFFSIKKFYDHLLTFQNIVTAGIPKIMSLASQGDIQSINPIDWLSAIFILLFQPFLFIGYTFIIFAHFVWYAICLIATILQAFGGYYNIPMDNMPNPAEYSRVIGNFAM